MDIYNLLKVRLYDFGMSLNYLNIIGTDLIFLLKIFSQQELETKAHRIELALLRIWMKRERNYIFLSKYVVCCGINYISCDTIQI